MNVADPHAAPKKRGRGADTERTRRELLDAAFHVLRHEGYRGATARTIANQAGQNQRAIYYHFGGIENLLVSALARSGADRLERYQATLDGVTELGELLGRLEELYRADVASGHMAVMTELLGGLAASPELQDGMRASIEPWLRFVRGKVEEVAAQHPLGQFVPADDVADLVFSLVVGVEMRNRLDDVPDRADRVFRLAQLGAALITPPADTSASSDLG